jgi:hypothetical protein
MQDGHLVVLNPRCTIDSPPFAAQDGNLDSVVQACSTFQKTYFFASVGVAGCTFDTSVAGVYPIVFKATDSKNHSVTATRTLTVQAVCPVGERLCANRVDCSFGGLCLGDMSVLDDIGDEFEELEDAVIIARTVTNAPPFLNLSITALVPGTVDVKQYTAYLKCAVPECSLNVP